MNSVWQEIVAWGGIKEMNDNFIISSCEGIIEEIFINSHSQIYEWEKLFLIRKKDGEHETIMVGFGGKVSSIEVEKGDKVIKGMVLALVKEELLASGNE